MMSTVKRPLIRYHGGKSKLAPWIISNFPKHRVYIEAFGGAGSVLLRKARSESEVYSDLDSDVVNLFRVARDRGQELLNAIKLTPFAREEFERAWSTTDDELEQARRTVVRACMGRDTASATKTRVTTFRAYVGAKRVSTVADWLSYPEALEGIIQRLKGLVIESRHAFEVMRDYDQPDALHYIDPPYVLSTRDRGRDYRHEFDDIGHEMLVEHIKTLKGMVVLSGYDNAIYSNELANWKKVSHQSFADGGGKRTELLWISPNAKGPQLELAL